MSDATKTAAVSNMDQIECITKPEYISITIDGAEIVAQDGQMLIDAAREGDVEIPAFCYERKLGPPVGACRMCMVEVEGIPKLQTACSTPVKDGMVVHTKTQEVKTAQESVVEFILVNHPLDCPVCDKGGECPLQDITMGWGPGRSRTTEPKRHFVKPVELSPTIAIDRERCILCYRCVRFSQEISEDGQLAMIGRGAKTYVGTFSDQHYLAPFSGNIIELCPVGALTSIPYRFSARPWDVENSASICTLCPAQCNINFTVRDGMVARITQRDNPDVDDGWLCDKGRFRHTSIGAAERLTQPMVRHAGILRPAEWDQAIEAACEGLKRAGKDTAALAGGETSNEEGYVLQSIVRQALGSPHIDCREGGYLDHQCAKLLFRPQIQAKVSDLDTATVILCIETDPLAEMPVIDLRIRKSIRLAGAKLVTVSSGDGGLAALAKYVLILGASETAADHINFGSFKSFCTDSAIGGVEMDEFESAAKALVEADNIVIVWGERVGHGTDGQRALGSLINLALLLGLEERPGSGLLEVPQGTNGRGLREVGCLPNMGPALSEPDRVGLSSHEMAVALTERKLKAAYLLHVDPMSAYPDEELWWSGLAEPTFVICHTDSINTQMRQLADVVFPAESYAERQGTFTHPDGRIQRQRAAITRPHSVRMEWQVLAQIARRLGLDLGISTTGDAYRAVQRSVPFYGSIELDGIAGRGIRWQETASAQHAPEAQWQFFTGERDGVK